MGEIKNAIHAFDVETIVFDDELSPGLVLDYFTIYAYIFRPFSCDVFATVYLM